MDRKNSLKVFKDLAIPFVMTAAAPLGACIVQNQPAPPPSQSAQEATTQTSVAPIQSIDSGRTETSLHLESKTTKELPEAPESGGTIHQGQDGSCWWHVTLSSTACPEGAICNPPPPRQVECPDELKKK